MNGPQTVIKVFLVNGESRSLRLDSRMDVTVGAGGRRGQRVCAWCGGVSHRLQTARSARLWALRAV